MATPLLLKRSSVSGKTPTTASLALGELALNTYDGRAFFKYNQGSDVLREIVTLDGTQTLSNKTLTSPQLNSATANNLIITGSLTANNSIGGSNQVLTATGSGGVQWATPSGGALATLTDVALSNPQAQQVLKYNGSTWTNADVNATVASAVFAPGASTDLGLVTDLIVYHTEDLGLVTDTPPALFYDLSILQVQGVVGLTNLDSSVRTDYIGYSIIFGF